MKKILYILSFIMFSCGNSLEEQLENLRDSISQARQSLDEKAQFVADKN